MSRYIDADVLRHRVLYWADSKNLQGNHEQAKAFNYCLCMIDDMPTVKVVRCKDCIHWSKELEACYIHDFCEIFQSDYYCASGERKEDDEAHKHYKESRQEAAFEEES